MKAWKVNLRGRTVHSEEENSYDGDPQIIGRAESHKDACKIAAAHNRRLLYAACPGCGADLEERVGEPDEAGYRWVQWYCPACACHRNSPNFAYKPY